MMKFWLLIPLIQSSLSAPYMVHTELDSYQDYSETQAGAYLKSAAHYVDDAVTLSQRDGKMMKNMKSCDEFLGVASQIEALAKLMAVSPAPSIQDELNILVKTLGEGVPSDCTSDQQKLLRDYRMNYIEALLQLDTSIQKAKQNN